MFKNSDSNSISFLLTIFFAFTVIFIHTSCKSSPKQPQDSSSQTEATYSVGLALSEVPTGAVELKVPEKSKKEYFSQIPQSTMDNVIKGTPTSLIEAGNALRKSGASITEQETVLLSIITDLLKIVYPEEAIPWTPPILDSKLVLDNAYLSIIEGAKNGVYDLSNESSDFLLLVLPSLVIKTTPALSNYYADSEIALIKASDLSPNSVFTNYLLGLLYQKTGQKSKALTSFKKAYELDTSCYQTAVVYLEELYIIGQKDEAYSLGKSLIEKYPTSIPLLKICTELSFDLGDIAVAEEYTARVLLQEPENAFFILFRAKILMKKGDFVKASSLLDVYARTDKVARDYLLLRASLQRDWNKNTTAAIATTQEAISLYSDDLEIILLAAQLASLTGQEIKNKNASFYIQEALEQDPNNEVALELLVNESVKIQDWQSAWSAGIDVLKNPNVSDSFVLQHIDICIELKKYSEAEELVQKFYQAHPDDENAKVSLIRVDIATGKISDASRLISEFLENASIRLKSSLYFERSRIASSEAQQLSDLRSSLTSNPRNEKALYELYIFYYKKQDYRKAQYYLKQVVALNPSNQRLLNLNAELENLLAR